MIHRMNGAPLIIQVKLLPCCHSHSGLISELTGNAVLNVNCVYIDRKTYCRPIISGISVLYFLDVLEFLGLMT